MLPCEPDRNVGFLAARRGNRNEKSRDAFNLDRLTHLRASSERNGCREPAQACRGMAGWMASSQPEWLESRTQPRGMAESEGFEPPIRCRIPDFESGAFDHSANSPRTWNYSDFSEIPAKIASRPTPAPATRSNTARRAPQRKRGPQPPHNPNTRTSRALLTRCLFPTRYFFAGAAFAAGAAAFAGAGAPLAAGAAPAAGATAATTVGPICGVTTFPLAFCSAM